MLTSIFLQYKFWNPRNVYLKNTIYVETVEYMYERSVDIQFYLLFQRSWSNRQQLAETVWEMAASCSVSPIIGPHGWWSATIGNV